MSLPGALIAGVIISLLPLSGAESRWNTLAPAGAGFTVEVPGELQPGDKPGHYVYVAGDWSYIIQVDSNSETIRESVANHESVPIAVYLDSLRGSMLKGANATQRSSSTMTVDGYPSVLFSYDGQANGQAFRGTDRIVVTEDHLYLVVAIGPSGPSENPDVERFYRSFHIVKSATESTAASRPETTGSSAALAARLARPMASVARLITEEKLSPQVDDLVQRAPPAQKLGDKWNASHPAWPKARAAFTKRIAIVADAYAKTDELEQTLDGQLGKLPSSDVQALSAALNGPAGDVILREQASMQFVTTLMADEPNGPKVGDPAWYARMKALRTRFNEQAGPSLPPGDKTHDADLKQYFDSRANQVSMSLWNVVVGKAATSMEGAINLAVFDDREAILEEIAAAVDGGK
jgi:hypothetical protein